MYWLTKGVYVIAAVVCRIIKSFAFWYLENPGDLGIILRDFFLRHDASESSDLL